MVCDTSGDEGLPQYAAITLTSQTIDEILKQHSLFCELKLKSPDAEMLRVIRCGDVDYYDSLREFPPETQIDLHAYHVDFDKKELFSVDFTVLKPHVKLPKKSARMSMEYLCIYANCVCWLGVPKHADGEIETKTIPIEDLTELLKGLQ